MQAGKVLDCLSGQRWVLSDCPEVCRHGAAADAVPWSALPQLLTPLHVTQKRLAPGVQVPEKEDGFHN